MNIGIMCHDSFGGSARVATELAVALAHRRHNVHLFTRSTPFDGWGYTTGIARHQLVPTRMDHPASHNGFVGQTFQPTPNSLKRLPSPKHPASLYTDWSSEEVEAFLDRILAVIRSEGLDVLHFHYALPFALIAAEIKRRLGAAAPRLIGTLHGTDVITHGHDPVRGPQLAQALPYLDGLTAVSTHLASLAAKIFDLPTRPDVIPNFVDLARFRPPSPATNGRVGTRTPRIIHISNCRPVKDTPSLARIFVEIRRQLGAELWLIGAGQDMAEVKVILRQGGVEQDTHYWGLQSDVAPFLAQADLLLMTSRYESFCLVALEAMACSVPVLAPKVGGLPEVVRHGETGYLFPKDNHATAVEWAVSLLSDPVQHRTMRQAAVRQAHRFGAERIVSAYEAMYYDKVVL